MNNQNDDFDIFSDKRYLEMLNSIANLIGEDKEYIDCMAHLLAEFEAKMQFAERSRQVREDLNLKLP